MVWGHYQWILKLLTHIALCEHVYDNGLLNRNFKVKGALSGLRQILATESPLKMMRNAFYFSSKALLVLEIFKFLS